MSDIESSNYSETAANNTAASPNGWPANSPPTIVYAADREMMAATKREWNRSHPTVTSSGTNTVTLTYTTAPAALVQGQMYSFIVGTTNTGAATLNVNSLGAKSIFMDGKALVGGEMVANSIVTVFYDGTQYQIVSSRALSSQIVRNYLINGDMEIWQRGAGGSASIAVAASTTAYTADRWYIATGANEACTVSQQTGLTNGSRYCMRVQRNSLQTGTGGMGFGQPLDSDVIFALRGQIVTISCKARSGANWSPTSGSISMTFYVGTGSPAKRGGGFTSETNVVAAAAALGTSSSVTTLTATASAAVPTNATQGELQFAFTPSGTAGTNDYVEIDEVMLCIAPVATVFDRRAFTDELSRCQGFYWKSFVYGTAPAQNTGTTGAISFTQAVGAATNQLGMDWTLPNRMRNGGTGTIYNPSASNAQIRNSTVSADCTNSVIAANEAHFVIDVTSAAGSAAGNRNLLHVAIDAEI